jgi:glutathione peroxidase
MRAFPLFAALAVLALASCGGEEDDDAVTPAAQGDAGQDVLRFTAPRLNGEPDDLSRYRGKVVLVVNTASECGFTPQFAGLERLYDTRRREGFVILGFPANDFAGQEPRSNEQIGEFCRANFGVSFPMFAKQRVTGAGAHPLFRALGEPDWNFNKYLLDRRGRLVERYGAGTEPADAGLTGRIDSLL